MLREETAKLLMMIQGAYPNYKPDNKTVTINTWNLALSDISFDLAQKAFLAYLRADTKGFAPTPGQLIALVRELNTPKQLNELEAWSLVEKAIRIVFKIHRNNFQNFRLWCKRLLGLLMC